MYFPFLIIKGKVHKGFLMRMGAMPSSLVHQLTQKENIWIHAVSVGEVNVIVNLIERIKREDTRRRIIVSTVTQTGYQLALSKMSDDDLVIYAPLDFSWIVKKYIQWIQPKVYISAETEIWPNLFTALFQHGVPIIIVNGRISDNSFQGYKKLRFFIPKVLQGVKAFCMQSQLDADRIIQLGAAPDRVRIVGNIKFDNIQKGTHLGLRDFGFSEKEYIGSLIVCL